MVALGGLTGIIVAVRLSPTLVSFSFQVNDAQSLVTQISNTMKGKCLPSLICSPCIGVAEMQILIRSSSKSLPWLCGGDTHYRDVVTFTAFGASFQVRYPAVLLKVA